MERSISLKKAYDEKSPHDGYRILVDRLWPRGITREDLKIDEWIKEIAPSNGLRKRFGHEPTKWNEFKKRYFRELGNYPENVERLVKIAKKGRLTLVYAAKDEIFNNATALKEYLDKKL